MSLDDLITLYKEESTRVFQDLSNGEIATFVQFVLQAYKNGCKIFACGNGGNAAIVGNLITDLCLHPFVSEDKSTSKPGLRLHAINLCESVSTITAIANDIGPDFIFSEQLKYSGGEDDLLIGISGSGGSRNIVEAINMAKRLEMKTIAVTKRGNTAVTKLADFSVIIEGTSQFPGQTGANDNHFHFEDTISKLSHIATGLLKREVQGS